MVGTGAGRGGAEHPTEQQRGLRRIVVPAFAKLPPAARRSVLHAFGKYAPWEDGFNPTPPQAATDEVAGPPDFVGIGTQKAGTTWWFDAICAHPDVFFRADIHKERHFFGRYAVRPFGPADCMQYHDWFPRPPGSMTGEWTPDYIHCPWVPALLAQAAPRARLLILLRDPVERFRSGLAHQRRDPRKPHGRDIPGRGRPGSLPRCTAPMGCVLPDGADPRPAVRAMHGRPCGPARSDVPLPRTGAICPRGNKDTRERHRGHSRPG